MKTLLTYRLSASRLSAAVIACAFTFCGMKAQQTMPAANAGGTAAARPKTTNSATLLDREYGAGWPKPSFPSSEREKKQFTVEYVYRYVQSDYTPAVDLPTVTRAQAQTDTPEHTLIALVSALKTLDYDWWLSLWDNKSQELFRAEAREKKQDAAYWRPIWQATFVGKPVILSSRLETVFDITLEFRIGAQQPGRPSTLFPATFRYESGHWALTRELGESTFLPWMGRPVLSINVDPIPVPEYSGKPLDPAAQKAQGMMFNGLSHRQSSSTEFVW